MGIEERRTDYFSNDINISLIDHYGLILELGNRSKRSDYIGGGQKQDPKTVIESFKPELLILKDQCLLKTR